MLVCINKKSPEYQTLLKRSGIPDSTLEVICRSFMTKYNRLPHLDEITNSNSEPSLRSQLKLGVYNETSISNVLNSTGKQTVEEANIELNNQYRDLEVEVVPLNNDAIIDITHRPTDNNFDNWSEEDEILSRASRDGSGNLLAPNGKISNLTEKQYAQVRTKAFKEWFGDWENDPANASKVVDENGEPLVVYHRSDIENLSIFDISKAKKEDKFLAFAYHFGTEKAADEVDLYGSNISSKYAVFLNIKNEFKWTDYDQGDFVRALKSLYNNDVISYEEMNKFRDYKYNKSAEERLNLMKSLFERMNKDGYSYINNVEDIGSKSWAVFNSNQIKSATSNSGSFNRFSNNIYDPEPNGYLVLNNALQKLAKLYGINFNTVTNAELNSDKWRNIISDPSSVNAFIYNGQIYINLDKASLDAPLHEMMHIFVGSIRFSDPKLYSSLISLAEKFPNYTETAKQFSGRTRNDINEEIFILEISRYLMGYKSVLHNLDNKTKYEISYNIKRLLDTILMGQNSVKTISNDRLFQLSLMQIAQEVNSAVMTNNFHGTINVENSELHRKLNNIKSDLYKQGILYCD